MIHHSTTSDRAQLRERAIALTQHVREKAKEIDMEVSVRRYGRVYPEALRKHTDDAAAAMSMHAGIIPGYLAQAVRRTDELVSMVVEHVKIPASAMAAWDYGCDLMHDAAPEVQRIGCVLALWALAQVPGYCEPLVQELRRELIRYDPALTIFDTRQ